MKIAACQFAISGDIQNNLKTIKKHISNAVQQNAELIVFPECALTGYPPLNISSASSVDFCELEKAHAELQHLSNKHHLYILTGTITQCGNTFHNTAILFSPGRESTFYHKRALWGWDSENFVPGSESGLLSINKLKIGVRICYEVRFPEYFRELYREKTDLNIVLFHDTCTSENQERYGLIKAHLRTRATENVTPILSANSCAAHQTAPTALFDRSGTTLAELLPGKEGFLIHDYSPKTLDFSEKGRKTLSDALTS